MPLPHRRLCSHQDSLRGFDQLNPVLQGDANHVRFCTKLHVGHVGNVLINPFIDPKSDGFVFRLVVTHEAPVWTLVAMFVSVTQRFTIKTDLHWAALVLCTPAA